MHAAVTEIRKEQLNRVLVVEDDADVLASFTGVLEMIGQEVRGAGDGPSALRIARQFRPNLAFIDIGLPIMDGYEVGRRLRAEHGASLRLFALTGFTPPSGAEHTQRSGFELHLWKPVDIESLKKLLQAPSVPPRSARRASRFR